MTLKSIKYLRTRYCKFLNLYSFLLICKGGLIKYRSGKLFKFHKQWVVFQLHSFGQFCKINLPYNSVREIKKPYEMVVGGWVGGHSIITFVLRRERVPSKCKRMRTGGEELCPCERLHTFFLLLFLYLVCKLFAIITELSVSFIEVSVLLSLVGFFMTKLDF